MKHNVGSYDAAVRFVAGCAVLFWGVNVESWWGLLGVLPVLTAVSEFCPLYTLLHLDTTFTDRT
jgi:hypothetical protein